ncbi:MAG: efflux RND transporter periplasmic adaptor subunit [Opitutaceae bacterium]|nr:efflux RND transporter periplasmic adaptor subunit [Opitutaceae bacterium]
MNPNIKYNGLFICRGSASLLFATCLLLMGCGKKETVEVPEVIRPVKMVQLVSGGAVEVVELPGQIFPARQANLGFEVPGQMIEISVVEGQIVSEGQLLARLDARDFEANRDAAKAQLDTAELEANRAQSMYDRQATSKQRLDLAVSNFKVAQASFEKAEKAYNDTFLRAPISGVVAKIYVDDIVNVRAKQEILVIQDNTSLKITVDIPETMGVLAKPGLSFEERTKRLKPMVYLTSLPNRGFPARITEIASLADPATRTYEGTLVFDRPVDLNVLPGMTARLELTLAGDENSAKKETYKLPSSAVISDEQGVPFVWVVDTRSMTVWRQSVKTGNLVGSEIEVISTELSEGDLVVVSGVHQLRAGDQVRKFEN